MSMIRKGQVMELAKGTMCLKRSLLKNSSESVLKERKQDSSFVPKKYLRHNHFPYLRFVLHRSVSSVCTCL